MERYTNVFQYPYSVVDNVPFAMRGAWREQYFKNNNPIVLELGCGRGEYAVELARQYPNMNFIGVDIKGARMWTGATMALNDGLHNVAFLRTNIEIIDRFFAKDEVQEIWLTFSDPQMKNPRKRLTSSYFLERYRHFLVDNGTIHLKTDSNFLFTYTNALAERNDLKIVAHETALPVGDIQTYYEQMWRERGIDIKYIEFLLAQEGELHEPDIEIELDSYRSYHRDKRSSLEKAK